MTGHEIRQSFLDYFSRQGHRIVRSSPLVPGDDPTLLFTNAGMNQFKDLFLGHETRDYRRATTAQKCMRVSGKHNDLDNVGPSDRHHTFFEMLGNFSFGDYFKADAIRFAWELLTGVWALPPDRLFPSIFSGEREIPRDEEAFALWSALVPPSRITALGMADNFWQMGETGPCGRCSEIMFFRGNHVPCPEPVCRGVACACERYVEVWNNVFMEFDRDASGRLTPLPAPSIDTGMGLERIAAVLQGTLATYDTDLFTPILAAIGERSGRRYNGAATSPDHPDVSMRVVADHLRAMTFLLADGVLPSNEWRGYVLRKIMRRAMRHGKKLGLTRPFLYELVDVVVAEMGAAYPELIDARDAIVRTVHAEEDRFDAVLMSGLPRLEELIDRTVQAGGTTVSGDELFRLYDSLGVPLDFAEDLAEQRGLSIDRTGYDQAMQGQRARARAAGKFKAEGPADVPDFDEQFVGYDTTSVPASIRYLTDDAFRPVAQLGAGDTGGVILDVTPFYVEAGGQVSDRGVLAGDAVLARVVDVTKRLSKARLHMVTVEHGHLAIGDRVRAEVTDALRDATRRNHTATHLLHAALRQRLGAHVRQAGSLVSPDRLRFDFSHHQPLTEDERRDVESGVNAQIYGNTPVTTTVTSTDEAISEGAMALFGEKYGDTVRMVSIGTFSKELCGGTHVRATGDIGPFVISEESGVAAGVRRIEALTGAGAVAYIQARSEALDHTLAALGAGIDTAAQAVAKLQAETRRLARENGQLKMTLALGAPAGEGEEPVAIGEARLVMRRVTGLDKDALRALSDSLRDRIKRGVVVLAVEGDGKVQLVVSVTKNLTDRVKAGQLVKMLAPIVGGGGGGRPDFAEAGGKDPSKIPDAFVEARRMVTDALAEP